MMAMFQSHIEQKDLSGVALAKTEEKEDEHALVLDLNLHSKKNRKLAAFINKHPVLGHPSIKNICFDYMGELIPYKTLIAPKIKISSGAPLMMPITSLTFDKKNEKLLVKFRYVPIVKNGGALYHTPTMTFDLKSGKPYIPIKEFSHALNIFVRNEGVKPMHACSDNGIFHARATNYSVDDKTPLFSVEVSIDKGALLKAIASVKDNESGCSCFE